MNVKTKGKVILYLNDFSWNLLNTKNKPQAILDRIKPEEYLNLH